MSNFILTSDLHTHTVYSHGKDTPRDMVKSAVDVGLSTIAISEHASGNRFYGLSDDEFLRLYDEILNLREIYPIQILMGVEMNMLGGLRTDPPRCEDLLSVRIMGYHKGVPLKNKFTCSALAEAFLHIKNTRLNTAQYLGTMERNSIDIISHPGLYISVDIAQLAREASKRSILLEINNHHPADVQMLKIAAQNGASFIIGSDAHRASDVGRFDNALCAALSAAVEERVVNLKRC